ncbi:MAG TPA: phosphoenolpyruvate--protein phosphotransferase, partial [Kineosporiaceae bacterium]|nr:phosphoenolpyruvate--protein phosphotransferase [Kineosporiaceae bacterium]
VDAAIEGFCDVLATAGGYLAERVADLRDVRNRALAHLLDVPMPGIPHPGHPFVLVGLDLAPADTATLDPAEVLALITELGGPTSHTAILAKGLGLPAVVQCAGALDLADGTLVVVDGSSGAVVIDPDQKTLAEAQSRAEARRMLTASGYGPGATADGTGVQLLVNIATVEDAKRASSVDSEGVGLFRTEGLYLGRQTAPTVEEQEALYREVFAAFGTRKIVVRTLDAGADKPLAFVQHGDEENPALGVRGLRVSRRYPDLLQTQLEALGRAAKASTTTVWVMAPMVSTAREARDFSTAVKAHGLAVAGAMIEVPAAALRAREVLREVDFVSIGTNDLAQYTFAADRMQGELADLLDPWQPALLDLIASVGEAGATTATPVGVCGEAAGDALLACVLVGLGVRSLSMAPGLVAAVRLVVGAHSLARCVEMATAARLAPDAVSARAAARELADERILAVL